MTTVAQTPGTWLKGGAGALWSAACKAALIACGINPDNFGSYSMRANAQGQERKKYREQRIKESQQEGDKKRPHEPNCPAGGDPSSLCMCIESDAAYKELGVEKWMLANSQSGHISQNAFYQQHRNDACSNIPPTDGNSGTYGYQDSKAFCMDHLGRANNPGTIHYEITNRESQFAQHLAKQGITVVPEPTIQEGVKGTAAVAAGGAMSRQKGNDPNAPFDKDLGKLTPERQHEGQRSDQAKDEHAAKLKSQDNASSAAGASGSADAGTPNAPSTKSPSPEDVQKAIECISDAWKQSLDEMRNDVINKHSVAGQSDECKKQLKEYNKTRPPGTPKAKGYTDLPKDRREKVDEAVKQKVTDRQKELEGIGAHDKLQKQKDPGRPTEKDCLEYQSNWLYNQHKTKDGTYPPMQGRVPDSNVGDDTSLDNNGGNGEF
ncbi:hypothetical protein [Hyalangium versicolor]|uniref:hypothetical protein n=1 Tax=Hyalangium versicolor TaxID=2861190 RepID=UPI001CCCF157|nr:hypothetical protein [Hyalangium versicolor]